MTVSLELSCLFFFCFHAFQPPDILSDILSVLIPSKFKIDTLCVFNLCMSELQNG